MILKGIGEFKNKIQQGKNTYVNIYTLKNNQNHIVSHEERKSRIYNINTEKMWISLMSNKYFHPQYESFIFFMTHFFFICEFITIITHLNEWVIQNKINDNIFFKGSLMKHLSDGYMKKEFLKYIKFLIDQYNNNN